MVVVAFSWVGNTGKTSLIEWHDGEYGLMHWLQEEWLSVRYLPEIARSVWAGSKEKLDMDAFQQEISDREYERSKRIKNNKKKYDVLLVDRTYADNMVYMFYNIVTGTIKKPITYTPITGKLYDKIFFFNEPIKETTNRNFKHYNDDMVSGLMYMVINKKFSVDHEIYNNGRDNKWHILNRIYQMFDIYRPHHPWIKKKPLD